MTEGQATWSLGLLIGVPIVIILILACIGAAVMFFKHEFPGAGLIAILCAVALVIGTAIVTYPWQSEYHQWVVKVGTVELISKRIAGGDKISEKFVARFTDGREFGCLDTRCANVRVGDTLVLTCKRTWQYAGTDGYDCNFVESRRATT